jgi:glycosyltransferase involved in cell wall biosynthesis
VPGSPVILEPSRTFDANLEQMLSRTLAQCGLYEDIPRKIEFLTRELDHLVQQVADRESSRAERARYSHLLQRWRRQLSKDGVVPAAGESAPSSILRALVIDNGVPKANRDAGSNAVLSHMRSLQRLGYEVTFIPSIDFEPSEADRSALDTLGIRFCCAPLYGSVEEVLRRQAGEFDVAYLHRVATAAKYAELVRQYCPRARYLFSVADLHHVRLARQATVEDRPELGGLIKRARFMELVAAASADGVITHSSYEARVLREQIGAGKVYTILWTVPARPTSVPFARRQGVAFIGGFDHEPNRDAARWLISEIMPLVRQQDPTIECLLVGSNLPTELAKLCGNGVVAVGHVQDLAEIFDRVRLTVAPLGYGAGIKGKVLESWAAGIPCVCTPIAAEGLEMPQVLQTLVADDAAEIATAIYRLHKDTALNEICRAAGLDYVSGQLSEENIDSLMRHALANCPRGPVARP